MAKSYIDYMKELTSDDVYEGLLAYGLFSDKLPPIFTSVPFFDFCKAMEKPFQRQRSEYISFLAMRNTNIPRQMGIPNPIQYQNLCSVLKTNWDNICMHLQNQTNGQDYRVSRIHIRKELDNKSIFAMDYETSYDELSEYDPSFQDEYDAHSFGVWPDPDMPVPDEDYELGELPDMDPPFPDGYHDEYIGAWFDSDLPISDEYISQSIDEIPGLYSPIPNEYDDRFIDASLEYDQPIHGTEYSKRIFTMRDIEQGKERDPESSLLIHDKGISHFLVKADIATCFPGLYTHAIPWAIVGKSQAKSNRGEGEWYNLIDSACRAIKDGETHGILIGPHASNVLSEIILTVIDKKLYDKGYRFMRYIDDYHCYVTSYEQAKNFLSDLEEYLNEFDFLPNRSKTQIIELPTGIDKEWKYQLFMFSEANNITSWKYNQTMTFMDLAFHLYSETKDLAVFLYLIKFLRNKKMDDYTMEVVSKRILHLAALYPYLLPYMEPFVFNKYNVCQDKIKMLSDAIYQEARRSNDFESICYSIYFALRYDFTLDELDIDYIIKHNDCLALLFSWLYYLKINHWKKDATEVKLFKKKAHELSETFMNRYWLFCYEVLSASDLSAEWVTLKKAGVSFVKPEFFGKSIEPCQ